MRSALDVHGLALGFDEVGCKISGGVIESTRRLAFDLLSQGRQPLAQVIPKERVLGFGQDFASFGLGATRGIGLPRGQGAHEFELHREVIGSFIAFIGEGGKYDLVEWTVGQGTDQNERSVTDYKGGVLWIRSGLEIERPGYRFAPFISVPFKQWATPRGDWPRSRARVGLRLMLR